MSLFPLRSLLAFDQNETKQTQKVKSKSKNNLNNDKTNVILIVAHETLEY